jgi:ABC-2 type transport system ATP-binding protein
MKIEVKNLKKDFNKIFAVNDISFTVEKNKTIGLLGPNGCGKTTSIGMMLGLVKPTSGNILIDDQDINKIDKYSLLAKMNFASPYIELPKKLSVKQNLEITRDYMV